MRLKVGEALIRLTGGRPMLYRTLAFIDRVSGKSVYRWTDRLGREWLAEGPWSLFRVEVSSFEAPMSDTPLWDRLWDLRKLRLGTKPEAHSQRLWDEEFPYQLYTEFGNWFARRADDIGEKQFDNRQAAVNYLRGE